VGRPDMIVHVGGIIPQEDIQALLDCGVHELFHTGTSLETIVDAVREATTAYEPLESDHPTAQLAREHQPRHAGETRRRMRPASAPSA
jgi:hypothetical protein